MACTHEEVRAPTTALFKPDRRAFLKRLGYLAVGVPTVCHPLFLVGCRSDTKQSEMSRLLPVSLTPVSTCSAGEISAEVSRTIITMSEGDRKLRNLKITHYYSDLSHAISTFTGEKNVNWCTFATWASKTAGTFIRQDTLKDKIVSVFKEPFPEQTNVVKRVSTAISLGNLKVFRELAPVFTQLLVTLGHESTFDEEKLRPVLEPLKPGATEDGGQDLLRSALRLYYEAKFTTHAQAKAEKILLANAQVGLHEQIRLQPNIADALNALPEILKLSPDDRVTREWREFVTDNFMRLELPNGSLRLGKDLPFLSGTHVYPPDLQEIVDPHLRQLLEEHDALHDSVRGSGASDWADFDQRMRFILTMFRSRQQEARLFSQPFTERQCADIARGKVPINRYRL